MTNSGEMRNNIIDGAEQQIHQGFWCNLCKIIIMHVYIKISECHNSYAFKVK